MKSRLLAGTAAIAMAVVGALIIIFYAHGADQRAVRDLDPVGVLVVSKAVPAGSSVDTLRAAVALQQVPGTAVAKSALNTLDEAGGKVTATDLVAGEQLLAERLVAPETVKAEGTVEVPAGFQEVSFQLEPQKAVGGRIIAGDHVGIFLSFDAGAFKANPAVETTQLTLHKVLLTAVQRAGAAEKPAGGEPNPQDTTLPEGALMLTVAVNDVDAGKIVFASEFGRIWLTKEPLDAQDNGPRVERKEVVYK